MRPLRGSEGHPRVVGWGPGMQRDPSSNFSERPLGESLFNDPHPLNFPPNKGVGGKWEEAKLLLSANENKVRGWVEGQGMVLVHRRRCMCVLQGGRRGVKAELVE